MMEKKKVIRKKKPLKKHIVVFQDDQEKVLKTVFIPDGEDAEAPPMQEVLEEKEHHRVIFRGWDQDLQKIHANLVVKPVYAEVPKEYLIMYFHENGKILGTETVPYGQDAAIPFHPQKPETEEFRYIFDGWSCALTGIDGDRMAKARFRPERKQFPVRFLGADSLLLKEEMVFYGQDATAPDHVVKAEDKRYRYHFRGWDQAFDKIHGPLTITAVFEPEYILYHVRFLEEGKEIDAHDYRYEEAVVYPQLHKKGYDYLWNQEIAQAVDSVAIDGHWEYSNPRGKTIERKEGRYEILNPSTSQGTVRLLAYSSVQEIVDLPKKVKLGDYFYEIEEIGSYAFSKCGNARKILCPDSVKTLDERCFAGHKRLEEVVLGKKLRKIGSGIFADSSHLRKVRFCGKDSVQLHKEAFLKANHRLEVEIPKSKSAYYEKILAKDCKDKQLLLRLY